MKISPVRKEANKAKYCNRRGHLKATLLIMKVRKVVGLKSIYLKPIC